MPYDGSGTFSAYTPGNPVVTGTTISSTAFNNTINDLCANGLSFAITKDGQQVPTANLPMGGFKLTGLGAGSAANDSARLTQIQNSGVILLGNVAGTNTITATLAPTLTAYASGQLFVLIPANTITSATTINIDSVGAKNVFAFGAACAGAELHAGVPALIEYDGTQFNVINPQPLVNTYVATLTGCTTAPTYSVSYTKWGDEVTICIPVVTATSNTTAKTLTGMPAVLRPMSTKRDGIFASDAGGAYVAAAVTVETSGVLTLYPNANFGNWTNSGVMSVQDFQVTYTRS